MLQNIYIWIVQNTQWLNIVVPGVICLCYFLMFYFYVFDSVRNVYEVARERVRNQVDLVMTRNKTGTFSYDAQQERLDRLGVTYRTKGKITPLVYLSYKFLMVLLGVLIGLSINFLFGILIGVGMWVIPDLISTQRNKKDNIEMLRSIMDMYDVILLQMPSGVSITRILLDTYQIVSHPRLKSALLVLTGDIVYTNDLNVAIETFSGKFQNENIQEFVVLVKQLAETGAAKEMLADVKRHMNTLQYAYNDAERRNAQKIGDVITVLLFIGIIAFIGSAALLGLGDASSLFSM